MFRWSKWVPFPLVQYHRSHLRGSWVKVPEKETGRQSYAHRKFMGLQSGGTIGGEGAGAARDGGAMDTPMRERGEPGLDTLGGLSPLHSAPDPESPFRAGRQAFSASHKGGIVVGAPMSRASAWEGGSLRPPEREVRGDGVVSAASAAGGWSSEHLGPDGRSWPCTAPTSVPSCTLRSAYLV